MSNSKGDVFMNRIFKVIWSKTKHCYIVVSEYAKANTKAAHTGLRTTAAAVAAAAMLLAPVNYNYVWAADTATVTDTNNKPQTVYTKDGADSTLEKETKAREAADAEIKQSMTDQKTDKALHVSKDGNLIVGTKEKQTVKDLKIRGQMASNSISTGAITATGDATVKGKVEAEAVYDDTTKTGNYVVQTNSVGANLSALDTQVKSNADAIKEEAQKRKYSVTNLEKADAAEAAVREAADTKLNTALAKETADRLGADAAQDKVIKQVNDNLVASVNTINESVKNTNENMAAGFTALSQADANEAATREAADTEIKQAMTDQKTSTALHISSSGDLIVGTKENQTVKDMEIRGKLASGSISTGDIISSGNVTVAGKMAADGVTDETTKDGTYIKQNNTVGNNLVSLDTQVKANADAIAEKANATDVYTKAETDQKVDAANTYTYRKVAAEEKAREAADTELNERITNEANAIHDEIKAGDKALDDRITNVKEYLEGQTADQYVSKADAAVQDGAVVKAANTIGDNVTNLDAALAKETAARIGADVAQDKVIQQVNDNAAAGIKAVNDALTEQVGILNQADANEAAARVAADEALDDKITAKTAARVAADAKLVEAVNSGLSLSNDNVLQKNTTTIDAAGNVTTSKTDANEMILNKGKDNQITMNEKGIKVGTNSTVMDKDGVYTGGNTYSEAKAALKSDGSIKGADGKFMVNSANGTVNVNDQIELNGATGVVKSNGLNVGDGNMTVSNNGNINTVGTLSAADGNFKVNSNGGVSAASGKTTLASDGSIKAADGKFTVNSNGGVKAADGKFTVGSNGAVKAANGNTTIDSNGNLKTAGTLSAADGSFKVDSAGKITSTGLDAGNGTIQTTGTVQAGDVKTGTLETTGDATIGGNLTVDKNLTVNGEFNAKTLSSKLDENNYTEIHGGKTESVNLKMNKTTGETQASASKFDETGSNTWAKDDDSIGRSTLTADSISQKLSNTGDNPTAYAESTMSQGTDNKYTMADTVKDGDKTNVAFQSAAESSDVISDATGKTSTFKQRVDEILNQINASDTEFSKVDQKVNNITSEVTDGTSTTSSTQTVADITNTAKNGTITNETQKLVNKASDTISNEAVKDITNTSTSGNISNTANNGTISNTAKTIENTASENITNTARNGSITNDAKDIANIASETLSNEAKDIANKASDNMTNTVGKDLTTTVGGNMSHWGV